MQDSKTMQRIIQKIAANHEFNYLVGDGNTLTIKNPPYMPLMITAAAPRRLYVCHYRIDQWGDIEYDPEVEFYVMPETGLWYPYAIQQPSMLLMGREIGGYRCYVEFEGNKPVRYARRLQADLAAFCRMWGRNIKDQGFK